MFVADTQQYQFLPANVKDLHNNGHFASIECENNKLACLSITYWQGIQAFEAQLDATFIKNSIGGTLLIACVKDGHNNIMIIVVAIIAIESEDSWAWFLEHIKANINLQPVFFIRDVL